MAAAPDTAKLVALLACLIQAIEELSGNAIARGRRLPPIQALTTADTGSKVTSASVVTDEANEKKAIYSPQLLLDSARLDAGLTLGIPSRVTAAARLDTMDYAGEANTSRIR
ncbi:iron-containing alcohol dehydrogenase [Microvirga sp. GCM10011540]|uniref:iron-containing alcohol dehydrogenase n=1 Tax=Microvirga sp. GCM10011540 TaxID=3317338 RepID=UPI00360C438A